MVPVGATTLPSRKRFLTNPNPYQASTSASPESSLSDSSSDRLAKKTRELPNLSDCHGCGYRINYSNPKERLQPLESMWRIVLLCRKCTNRVKSSDLCPYCFSATAGLDCFKCRECQRRIHKDCVGKYGGIAPSYCCSGLGFDVCIDCWVPNSLANSIRLCKRNSRNKVNVSPVTLPKPDFRVLMGGSYGTKMPKKVAEDANIFMQRKVADAVKEKKIALQKAVVAKSAVELANGALNLVASSEPVSRVLVGFSNGTKSPKEVAKDAYIFMARKVSDAVKAKEIALRKAVVSNCAVELANGALNLVAGNENGKHISVRDYFVSKALNDAELAFLFHRAMNSSALISRSKCLVDSSSLAVPEVLHASGSASTNACSELEIYGTNSKLSEKINKTVSEVSICFKTSHCGPFIDLSNGEVFGANISSDDNECQGHCEGRCNAKADRYLLKYHRTDKNVTKPSALCKFSDSDSCADLVSSIFGAVTDTRACLNCNELQGNGEGRCDEKHDRYFFKYTRACQNGNDYPGNGEGNVSERHDNCMLKYTKTCVNGNDCKGKGEGSCNEYLDRYMLKYTRTRFKGNECQGNGEGRFSVKSDRYSLKYTRKCLNGTECKGNGERCKEKPDRYLLKYEKRSINSRPVSSC